MIRPAALALLASALCAPSAFAAPRVSHHGGPILHCEPPQFFDQTPAKDSKAASIQDFSFTASDNTDRETLKVWANNEPVEVKITEQRSGQLLVEGRLKEAVTRGKVWFRVAAESNDGCDENTTWNIYTEK